MRVCKHSYDVKMFCFSNAYHASMNLKKVLSWKTQQVSVTYPLPGWLKLEKSLETCCVNFFFAWADIIFLFCKTKIDYTYKLCVQDFATGKNFSFNQSSKQEHTCQPSWIRHQSPGLPYGSPYLPDKIIFWAFLCLSLKLSPFLAQNLNFSYSNYSF